MDGKATRIQIANIPVAATTETAFALPKGCRWFQIQCRTAVAVQIAVGVQESNVKYFTMKTSTVLKNSDLEIENPSGLMLYLYAASAVTVEAMLGISEEGVI